MTSKELQEFIGEVITFLQAVDKVIPSKIDQELVAFLQGIKDIPWLADMLVKVLGNKK